MNCRQCGAPLNPVAVMLGPVCGACTRSNHRRVAGPGRPLAFRDLPVGATFQLDHGTDARRFEKLSARQYMGDNGATYTVGSVGAFVTAVGVSFHAAGAAFIPTSAPPIRFAPF